jgi:hypothetical protein
MRQASLVRARVGVGALRVCESCEESMSSVAMAVEGPVVTFEGLVVT